MGEKLVIGPINKGLRTDRLPFNIDNDSFPTLLNAYQWRSRLKRKRGTALLGRLSRWLGITNGAGNLTVTIKPTPILTGIVSFTIGTDVFVDPGTTADPGIQTLITNSSGTGTLDRVNGILTITGSKANTAVIYYPTLPVMGLEDLVLGGQQNPGTLGFDTKYSYNITTGLPAQIYDVSFYKNPQSGPPGYVPKGSPTPTTWNAPDYRQFWTINYQGALWATNTVNVPFNASNIGMQFASATTTPALTAATWVSPTSMTFTIVGNPLVVGDFVFVNEFIGPDTTATQQTMLNFQTGYVTVAGDTFTVVFPNANLMAGAYTPGMLQYLTNRSNTAIDTLRWYDGDPTNGSTTNPTYLTSLGWVNFMPPLSKDNFSIADLPAAKYYLVGAKAITNFKDRLLFIGPVVQTSSGNSIYLQDTVIYSQNGTPYYTASFQGDPTVPTNLLSILVPVNQTATPNAYFEDQTGFGGFITAGIDQAINTVTNNEDVLLLGFDDRQTRFVYTGNDLVPFNFFTTNIEFGSKSQFSGITLDKGAITRGSRGYTLNSQTGTQRIDIPILDQVYEVNLLNNGTERFSSQRDFINEWIYFTYPSNKVAYKYPNQTLLYNYRDDTWAIFDECYTTYGTWRQTTGLTWATVGLIYPSWDEWNVPWNAGSSSVLAPIVIAGNQQGFVLFRDKGTEEATSLYIQNIVGNLVTSPNHCLDDGDYIIINNALGNVGAQVNGQIFQVTNPTTNTFNILPPISSATYLGGGTITRMYIPQIQTKQFPVAWDMARKTRLGPQQYLISTTNSGQITLLLFLSQNSASAYNDGNIVPQTNVVNNALIYSTVLYTCPESTNLGLTPASSNMINQANTNLQMIIEPQSGVSQQQQIWHRMNTSLLGDTVQIGFTLSDAQMRSFIPTNLTFSITAATNAYPAVLTAANNISAGTMVQISGVQGMTGLNNINNTVYQVMSADPNTITLNIDSTLFGTYSSGGTVTVMEMPNQFEEIEIHSMILDISPSSLLA